MQAGGIPFRVPGAAIVPLLTCLVIAGLLTSITWPEWRVLLIIVAVATVVFFLSRGARARLAATPLAATATSASE